MRSWVKVTAVDGDRPRIAFINMDHVQKMERLYRGEEPSTWVYFAGGMDIKISETPEAVIALVDELAVL